MISAGDHERLPDDEDGSQDTYNLSAQNDGKSTIDGKFLRNVRKGVKLESKSKTVDRMNGMTMEEYTKDLELRSKGIKPNSTHIEPTLQPSSPINSRVTRSNLTIPSNKLSNSSIANTPIDLKTNSDMSQVFKLAMEGKSGFNMSDKLRNRLMQKKGQ